MSSCLTYPFKPPVLVPGVGTALEELFLMCLIYPCPHQAVTARQGYASFVFPNHYGPSPYWFYKISLLIARQVPDVPEGVAKDCLLNALEDAPWVPHLS